MYFSVQWVTSAGGNCMQINPTRQAASVCFFLKWKLAACFPPFSLSCSDLQLGKGDRLIFKWRRKKTRREELKNTFLLLDTILSVLAVCLPMIILLIPLAMLIHFFLSFVTKRREANLINLPLALLSVALCAAPAAQNYVCKSPQRPELLQSNLSRFAQIYSLPPHKNNSSPLPRFIHNKKSFWQDERDRK